MHFPGREWSLVKPEAEALDSAKLQAAVDFLKANAGRDGVRELLIARNGRVVWEGDAVTNVHGVWSVTKSFTSTCLGLLMDGGRCSLDTPAASLMPTLSTNYSRVTLRHFTSMTSGYRAVGDEPRADGYTHGPSRTPFAPGPQPLFPPGAAYAYWDSAMNMFALVLTRAAGEPLEQLFRRRIAEPIAMDAAGWRWGDFGEIGGVRVNGGAGNQDRHVFINARQLARLGHLFLNRGRWNDRQLISSNWVRAATSTQVPATLTNAWPRSGITGPGAYGFNWWCNGIQPNGKRVWPGAPPETFAALGYNNNKLIVIPPWQMVVVRMGLDEAERKIGDDALDGFLRRVGEARLDAPAAGSTAGRAVAEPPATSFHSLTYAPAPPDNPLKGFVPYLRADATFPHSLEWDYTKLSDVMTGPTNFNWAPFDAKLSAAAARGHQFIARFYLEWPGKTTGVPQYLIDAGLPLRRWTNTNTQPHPPAVDHTPDYEDPRLRAALTNFIHALGHRYDGDPRLGFVGLGLLGTWGEWHNYPNQQWFASKTVQREVMDAFEEAFKKTKLVVRYPAGTNDSRYADNSTRAIGYHDDSFAWATVHTGRRNDDWFFETRLRAAGALDKWHTQPIGGEVRPEVWKCLFDEPSCAPKGQEFDRCVEVTHASWLCNEGVFRGQARGAARERALRAAQRLGYELHVARVALDVSDGQLNISIQVTNTGVAPFYYDWPVELAALDDTGRIVKTWNPDWKLTGILPGESAPLWRFEAGLQSLPAGAHPLLLRVPNPLPIGSPLRFANREQDQHLRGWLTLGIFECP